MKIRVGAWNIHDGFSDEARIATILQNVDAMDVDVAVFPEAYAEGSEQHLSEVSERLRALGYIASRVLYDDDDGRLDRHGLLVINRYDTETARPLRMGTRNALRLDIDDCTFVGLHLDDRSERRRYKQACTILGGSIIAGDFNATARRVVPAKVTTLLPAHFPTEEQPVIAGWERKSNIIHRVGGMMSSRVAKLMREAEFIDTNREHKATWPSRKPLLALDRILHKPDISTRAFTVHERVAQFDHLPISATLEY